MKSIVLTAVAIFLTCSAAIAIERESIEPPFGLSWVENRARIAQLLDEAHLRLAQKEKVDGREIWTVDGFDQPGLSAVLFTFAGDNLDGLELQYRDPSWSLGRFGEFMEQIKQELDLKYGRGAVLAHSRGPEKDVSQTVVGYRWQQPDQALDLVFYSAEREPLAFRLLSMRYSPAHH